MEYREFFERVKGFLEQAEIHKRRGNNDFNPYLEMWSESNEVKLHSALISGFLNPLGKHYQGDVFLETFLECVGLKEWFGDTRNARVYKEYKNIDMYITNNDKHIIIENKIWAGDQDRQIERYIDKIVKEQSRGDTESSESKTKQINKAYDNTAVLYLAPDERKPSKYSLGKWEIQGDYLVNGDKKVEFKAISYKDEILKWIEKSQAKVGCITNLNAALLFYKDVVQIITKTKENTMRIEKFLTENEGSIEGNMKIVFEILRNKAKIFKECFAPYFEKIIEKYQEQIEEQGFEIVKSNRDETMGRIGDKKDLSYPYIIKPKDCGKYYFAFCVEYYIKEEIYNCYGVKIFHQNSILDISKTEPYKTIKEYLKEYLEDIKEVWWLNDNQKFWWYELDTSITELESNLQAFLDSSNIKALNEKLKEYQA